jgi:hypothetical protein
MALDWLKGILGDAYTDEIDGKVAQEIGKGFVSRADFNAKNDELKAAKTTITAHEQQLEKLKGVTGTAEELNAKITDLQKQNAADKAAHDAEIAGIRLNNAVEKALADSGARNSIAARALLADFLKDAKVGEDGTVKGLSDAVSNLAKAEDTAFLFEKSQTTITGATPAATGGNNAPPPKATGAVII